jgi:hypothetical protein
MALNNSTLARTAARFKQVLIGPTRFKADTTGNQGTRPDRVLLTLQAAPAQSVDVAQVLDSNGNVLFSVDQAGNFKQGGVTGVAQSVKQVTLTAAQIITLNTVPVPLVAAPGAGKAIIVYGMLFQYKFGTIQFTGGGTVNPVHHGAATNLLTGAVAAATIQAAANALVSAGSAAVALPITVNVGIDLLANTGNFAAGDGTAIVTLFYDVVTQG